MSLIKMYKKSNLFLGLLVWVINLSALIMMDLMIRILKKNEIDMLLKDKIIVYPSSVNSMNNDFPLSLVKNGLSIEVYFSVLFSMVIFSSIFVIANMKNIKKTKWKVMYVAFNVIIGFFIYLLMVMYYGLETCIDSL